MITIKLSVITLMLLFHFWRSYMTLASLVVQLVKNLPEMPETRVQSLEWEDSLEKGISNHSSILVWRIPWTEKPCRLQLMGSQRVDTTKWLTLYMTLTILYLKFFWFVWFCFFDGATALRILVPWPEIESVSPAVEVQSLNHWTAREVPIFGQFLVL